MVVSPELYLCSSKSSFSLTHCMLGNFSCFCCQLLTFYEIDFLKKSFRNTIRVSNALDPDQDKHSDLGPNCLQWLSTDDKSW